MPLAVVIAAAPAAPTSDTSTVSVPSALWLREHLQLALQLLDLLLDVLDPLLHLQRLTDRRGPAEDRQVRRAGALRVRATRAFRSTNLPVTSCAFVVSDVSWPSPVPRRPRSRTWSTGIRSVTSPLGEPSMLSVLLADT